MVKSVSAHANVAVKVRVAVCVQKLGAVVFQSLGAFVAGTLSLETSVALCANANAIAELDAPGDL
jgi:hypothetical protein